MKLRNALYGIFQAAIIFWQDLMKTLTDRGFIINSYDHCAANKIINGRQCIVLWYVEDPKISHVSILSAV